MANPSRVIFAGVLASKVRKIKIKIKIQSQQPQQRLVKHNFTISLHSFLKTCSACLFDFNGRRERNKLSTGIKALPFSWSSS